MKTDDRYVLTTHQSTLSPPLHVDTGLTLSTRRAGVGAKGIGILSNSVCKLILASVPFVWPIRSSGLTGRISFLKA